MFINYIASPINAGALAMIAGLIVVPVVSVITKKPDEAIVDEIFNCLDEKVMVEQKWLCRKRTKSKRIQWK